jgi:glycosyltransferase involved in cell wall biosynthesis
VIGVALVVVPARDEEELLPACLASLRRAAGHPELAGLSVRIAVVLDSCSDRSGDVAAPLLRARDTLIEQRAGNVGIARGLGIDSLLTEEAGRPLSTIWVANTDADSRVPFDWLARQVRLANAGADAVAGTIVVDDWHEHPAQSAPIFADRYAREIEPAGHHHVHGANLGVRASTYRQIGGGPPLPLAEDHALVHALERAGATIARPATLRVVTSGRRESRARGGFSDFLRALPSQPGEARDSDP